MLVKPRIAKMVVVFLDNVRFRLKVANEIERTFDCASVYMRCSTSPPSALISTGILSGKAKDKDSLLAYGQRLQVLCDIEVCKE